ncbi:hypothetical protein GS415_04875 [Rhodococcus hoagii]|nr:hypothetical protein [Prescottella equi]
MKCQYADLFRECDRPAVVVLRWRRWGEIQYCGAHHTFLTHTHPSDLIETRTL